VQGELDNKAGHLLLPMTKKEKNRSNYTCSIWN